MNKATPMATPKGDEQDNRPARNNSDDSRQAFTPDNDIRDSERDQERLKPDTANIELPDVEDIPGQEHVHVLPMGELGDSTPASDDEEGKDLFGDE